jgi:hypothetical protein
MVMFKGFGGIEFPLMKNCLRFAECQDVIEISAERLREAR